MSGKNGNYGPQHRDRCFRACPLCEGTGKTQHKPDDTDIGDSDAKEVACPLCKGRGTVKAETHLYRVRTRSRSRCKSRRLMIRRPGLRGGSRRLVSGVTLLAPGTPLAGWLEGDGVPKSQLIPGNVHPDSRNQPEPVFTESPGPTILTLAPGISVTIGEEFAGDFVLDTDLVDTTFQHPLGTGSDPITAETRYGVGSAEWLEATLPEELREPNLQGAIIGHSNDVFSLDLDHNLLLEPRQILVSDPHSDLLVDFQNETPAAELTGQPIGLGSAAFTYSLPPATFNGQDGLDITQAQDPVGFDIDTDIVGQTW